MILNIETRSSHWELLHVWSNLVQLHLRKTTFELDPCMVKINFSTHHSVKEMIFQNRKSHCFSCKLVNSIKTKVSYRIPYGL